MDIKRDPEFTQEQMDLITDQLIARGLGGGEYFPEAKVTVTDIKCPHCDKILIVTQLGNSMTIECQDKDCSKTALRGI